MFYRCSHTFLMHTFKFPLYRLSQNVTQSCWNNYLNQYLFKASCYMSQAASRDYRTLSCKLNNAHSLVDCCEKSRPQTLIKVRNVASYGVVTSSMTQTLSQWKNIRQNACNIFGAAVDSVYPPLMIKNTLSLANDGRTLTVAGREYILNNNVYVVGFGKAVSGMAKCVVDMIGDHIVTGIISVPLGSQRTFMDIGKHDLCVQDHSKTKVYEGAKDNMPDEQSHHAALAIKDLVQKLKSTDILIVLISGGGSALLPTPEEPVTLQDELELTRIVSRNGGTINELNVLRQNLETLKGGGLAELAKPAKVISLILSDVIDDKLDIISSGPTTSRLHSHRQSLQILEKLKIIDKVPAVIVETLKQKAMKKSLQDFSNNWQNVQTHESKMEHVQNVIIGSNSIATQAAAQKASELGYIPVVLSNSVQGEVRVVAKLYNELAKYAMLSFGIRSSDESSTELCMTEIQLCANGFKKANLNKVAYYASQAYNSKRGLCIICGGETTVRVTGNGKGGRNQEMALAFAIEQHKLDWANKTKIFGKFLVEFLSAGTDGQDGPTDAAGAAVNHHLVPTAVSAKLNPMQFLDNNDSHTLFKSIPDYNALIVSGFTGTNVMDIQVLLVQTTE